MLDELSKRLLIIVLCLRQSVETADHITALYDYINAKIIAEY